ncbi:hypothetical protein LEN26_004773 [Aphanomyces euteiches]|nr:hypothetical protein AeMF1_020469 [Aphanomyces euteiches]KAH9147233.1 hypothetical protein LEN26_004773 [Aphanomyces euteiches]KAH9182765.1 hypothetical protein AeNC1_015259 [Aphanomyces euteiches]
MQERADNSEAVIEQQRAEIRENRLRSEVAEALSAERAKMLQRLLSERKCSDYKMDRRDEQVRQSYVELRDEVVNGRANTFRVIQEELEHTNEQIKRLDEEIQATISARRCPPT